MYSLVRGISDSSVVCILHLSTPTSWSTGNGFSGCFRPIIPRWLNACLSTLGCVYGERGKGGGREREREREGERGRGERERGEERRGERESGERESERDNSIGMGIGLGGTEIGHLIKYN